MTQQQMNSLKVGDKFIQIGICSGIKHQCEVRKIKNDVLWFHCFTCGHTSNTKKEYMLDDRYTLDVKQDEEEIL